MTIYWRIPHTWRAMRELVARPNLRPIFVFGNQKSGTTAIAALLGYKAKVSTTLDLEREWQSPTYQHVVSGERTIEWFCNRNRLEMSRRLIKEPNFRVIWRELLSAFPSARSVLVVRDPRDNVRSVLDRLDLPGDQEEIGRADRDKNGPGWSLYLRGGWLGLGTEQYIEVMAHRWRLGYEFLLANRGDLLLIRYEDFVRDKEAILSQAVRAMGLRDHRQVAAAQDRQYQPRGRRQCEWFARFGARNLERIEQICSDGMDELGYTPRHRSR